MLALALPDRFRQGRAPGLATEADRLAQPFDQGGAARTVAAVPLDRLPARTASR